MADSESLYITTTTTKTKTVTTEKWEVKDAHHQHQHQHQQQYIQAGAGVPQILGVPTTNAIKAALVDVPAQSYFLHADNVITLQSRTRIPEAVHVRIFFFINNKFLTLYRDWLSMGYHLLQCSMTLRDALAYLIS